MDDFVFYCFQRREIIRSKEDTSNNKHATAQESIAYSSNHWDATILQMFYQKLCYHYGTYH
jgi:hypothetical protein